uniref:Transporter, CPA2 family n=1 Tax=Chlorobium chlorochromatii (strain CaD3) TaxID=340177 RepID=Q3ARA8_CHLCH
MQMHIALPLQNPVLQFSLLLFIILFAPLLFRRFKLPGIISLIIAGALIGPHGFNLMLRDSSIVLFGTVGLLYIMFLAGLEIDVADFRKNSSKSILFGLYTFFISIILGIGVGYYILNFPFLSSILIGSIFASHTLIIYPTVSKLGITKNKAVTLAIGGTIVTDTLALLLLAGVVGLASGELNTNFWLRLLLGVLLFATVILWGLPIVARWFFKRFDDSVLQYLFVLALVFFSAFLAEAAGVEPIIGAFFGGIALNRLIPRTSSLMNRIKFVGNALFIPFFLIGVGMLIDIHAFFKGYETILVAFVITVSATVAKYSAAWIAQKMYGFSIEQRRLIFGLISAHAAVALATVMIGYGVIIGKDVTGQPIRLLDESVLNGTILFVLLTCTLATFVGEKGAYALAGQQELAEPEHLLPSDAPTNRFLLHINHMGTVKELVNVSGMMVTGKMPYSLYGAYIATTREMEVNHEYRAEKMLERAVISAGAADRHVTPLLRYDTSIANGLAGVICEQKISDLFVCVEPSSDFPDTLSINKPDNILGRCGVTTFIYRPTQPFATIKRTIAVVPDGAEADPGFRHWLERLHGLIQHSRSLLMVYASTQTTDAIKATEIMPIIVEYKRFRGWENFTLLSQIIRKDDLMVLVMSRRNNPAWHHRMATIPAMLHRYFQQNSYLLIYPLQNNMSTALEEENAVTTYTQHLGNVAKVSGWVKQLVRGKQSS